MDNFLRFPHTPHIAWLGLDKPRDDKVLSPSEVEMLLNDEVVLEEKLDGANLGISLGPNKVIRAQNRGQYLVEPYSGQFTRLQSWLAQHEHELARVLNDEIILFGEWCAAKHSLDYESLPDWFLLFDVFDRNTQKFWSSKRRNDLASAIGLAVVPEIQHAKFTLKELISLLSTKPSCYRNGSLEGIVIRRESVDWCESRAKLVRADFTQNISTHWRKRNIKWNRISSDPKKPLN